MRYTQILVIGGLLVAALIASYLTWTYEPAGGGKGDVVAFDVAPGSLTQVVYTETDLRVAVEQRSSEASEFCWGQMRKIKDAPRKPPRKPPQLGEDPGDDDSAAEVEDEEPERIVTDKSFRGNETCDKVLARFAPMKALRVFEDLSEEKIAEMELAQPEASLTVTSTKGERVYDVGGRCYGSNDYYLREQGSGRVLLVESRMIGDIKGGSTRLMESKLQPFKKDEIERAEVSTTEGQREFVQQNRDDSKAAFWSTADEPAKTADAADTWLDRILRLRALSYFSEPPAGLLSAVRIRFVDGDQEIGWVEFGSALDEEGETIYVARTGNTIEWVKISDRMGADTIEEIGGMMD